MSLADQSQVHAHAKAGDNVFVGMQALVLRADIGERIVIEQGAKIIGVKIPAGRYVPALSRVTTQDFADELPTITADYLFGKLNDGVVHLNVQLADSPRVAARLVASAD